MQREAIQQIHDSPVQVAMAITGGGSLAISRLLTVPGASRTVLEAVVPYSQMALRQYLGSVPDSYCDERTARAMAMRGFLRARELAREAATCDAVRANKVVGIGCTASLASDRSKRGEHRAHIGIQSADATRVATLHLAKGTRTRSEEESLVADLIVRMLTDECGLPATRVDGLRDADSLAETSVAAETGWREILTGESRAAQVRGEQGDAPRVLFPGSFNPFHHGHRQMAEIASRRLNSPTHFEIAVVNVDKLPLDYLDIAARLRQFTSDDRVWLTGVPTFAAKSLVLPGVTFVVGADTIRRVADPKYYGGDTQALDSAIRTLAGQRCRFLVFGRTAAGDFVTLRQLELPNTLAAICDEVGEAEFRADISSTELRELGDA